LRVHGGELLRVDGIERAEEVQLAIIVRRRVAQDRHLDIHVASVENPDVQSA
jgi:hypothetical protein